MKRRVHIQFSGQKPPEILSVSLSLLLIPSLIASSDYCGKVSEVTHIHTQVSGEGTTVLFVSARGRGAKWNVHCFQTRRSPQISPPRSSMGGRGCILGVVCVCVLRGWGLVGGSLGFGHVGVFANSTNRSTAELGIHLIVVSLSLFTFSHLFSSLSFRPPPVSLTFNSVINFLSCTPSFPLFLSLYSFHPLHLTCRNSRSLGEIRLIARS